MLLMPPRPGMTTLRWHRSRVREEGATDLLHQFGAALPEAYKEDVSPREAIPDIANLAALKSLVIAASDCTMLLVFLRANIASPCVDLVSPLNCSNSCLCLPVWVLTSSRNVRMN